MQQKLHFLFLLFIITLTSFAQVANQPSDLEVCDDNNDGFAQFDLSVLNAEVLGGQNPADFTLTYYETQSDADNAINPIFSPYVNIVQSMQTIFIRLEANATENVDITTVNLIVNPSPDAGSDAIVELCSSDSSVDLFNTLGGTPQVGGNWWPQLASGTSIFDPSIDAAESYTYTVTGSVSCPNDSSVVTVFVNSVDFSIEDISYCIGDTVSIDTGLSASNYSFVWSFNGVVIVDETQASLIAIQSGIYSVLVTDFNSGCSSFSMAVLEEIDCTDTDDDGVIDSDEDVNENGNLEDDDTDNDDIPNYLDDDDDGDNVDTSIEITFNSGRTNTLHTFIDTDDDTIENYLDDDDDGDNVRTIDEDYNNNGDPTDDDTNMNSIPDYLESAVALSLDDFYAVNFSMFPNPAEDKITIQLVSTHLGDEVVRIYNIQGKEIQKPFQFESNRSTLDVSGLQSGLYFVKLVSGNQTLIQKLIIN